MVCNSVSLAGGQCHVPDPGSQEPDERCGADSQGLLCGIHQVPEVPGHGLPQPPSCLLEDEGSGEEAAGQEGETGRDPDKNQEGIPEEAREPRAGPKRVQGHGEYLEESSGLGVFFSSPLLLLPELYF